MRLQLHFQSPFKVEDKKIRSIQIEFKRKSNWEV